MGHQTGVFEAHPWHRFAARWCGIVHRAFFPLFLPFARASAPVMLSAEGAKDLLSSRPTEIGSLDTRAARAPLSRSFALCAQEVLRYARSNKQVLRSRAATSRSFATRAARASLRMTSAAHFL